MEKTTITSQYNAAVVAEVTDEGMPTDEVAFVALRARADPKVGANFKPSIVVVQHDGSSAEWPLTMNTIARAVCPLGRDYDHDQICTCTSCAAVEQQLEEIAAPVVAAQTLVELSKCKSSPVGYCSHTTELGKHRECNCDNCVTIRDSYLHLGEKMEFNPLLLCAYAFHMCRFGKVSFAEIYAGIRSFICFLVVVGSECFICVRPYLRIAQRHQPTLAAETATALRAAGRGSIKGWFYLFFVLAFVMPVCAQGEAHGIVVPPTTLSQLWLAACQQTFAAILETITEFAVNVAVLSAAGFQSVVNFCAAMQVQVLAWWQHYTVYMTFGLLALLVLGAIWLTFKLVEFWYKLHAWVVKQTARALLYVMLAFTPISFLLVVVPYFFPGVYSKLFAQVSEPYHTVRRSLTLMRSDGRFSTMPTAESLIRGSSEPQPVATTSDLPKSLVIIGGYLNKDSTVPFMHGMASRVSFPLQGKLADGLLLTGHQYTEMMKLERFSVASARNPGQLAVVFAHECSLLAAARRSDLVVVSMPPRVYSALAISSAQLGVQKGKKVTLRMFLPLPASSKYPQGWAVNWATATSVVGGGGIAWHHNASTIPSNSGCPMYTTYGETVVLVHVAGGPKDVDNMASYNCASSTRVFKILSKYATAETTEPPSDDEAQWVYEQRERETFEDHGDFEDWKGRESDSDYDFVDDIVTRTRRYEAVRDPNPEQPNRVTVRDGPLFGVPLKGLPWADEETPWYAYEADSENLNSTTGSSAPLTSVSLTTPLVSSGGTKQTIVSSPLPTSGGPQSNSSAPVASPTQTSTEKEPRSQSSSSIPTEFPTSAGPIVVPEPKKEVSDSKLADTKTATPESYFTLLREEISMLRRELASLKEPKGKEKESSPSLNSKASPESGSVSVTTSPGELSKAAKRRAKAKAKAKADSLKAKSTISSQSSPTLLSAPPSNTAVSAPAPVSSPKPESSGQGPSSKS